MSNNKQIIPHNEEAEGAVLGSVLIDSSQVASLDLQPSAFFDSRHQAIYQAALDLYRQGEGIDQITVAHELQRKGKLEPIGGVAYLSHLISITPTSIHAPYYAKVLRDCSFSRSLITAGERIAQVGYRNEDPQQSVTDSHALLSDIEKSIPATQIWSPKDIADNANKRYAQLRNVIPGISTGFRQFDRWTGGFFNGDYIILASRPGMGKSSCALQIAKQIGRRGHKALFISLEMMPEAIIDKMVASLIGRPASMVRRGNYSDELLGEITLSLGQLAEANLYLCRGPATTGSLRQIMERMKLSYGLDIAFIDYLQLLRDRYGGNDNERIGFISGELAAISKEFNVPVVVLSQLSRALEARSDKRPLLSDLRSSGSLEQDADLILFLSRESYYNRSINLHGAEAELLIGKSRMGGIGKLSLYWDAHKEKYVNSLEEVGRE
jgi:replicative DNA helicase